jgi:hypothetical protein
MAVFGIMGRIVTLERAASTRVFTGAYTMGNEGSAGHTCHGMGGLFFIAEEP